MWKAMCMYFPLKEQNPGLFLYVPDNTLQMLLAMALAALV
jgi:hypothetical protein